MRREAPAYLADGGHLYFAVSSLSNHAKIIDTVRCVYREVHTLWEGAFPLTDEEKNKLLKYAEEGTYSPLKKKGSRYTWQAWLLAASRPH